ncbi:MAG: hypothetical protein PHC38_07620, partial [Weeksellaceae bacterium]|nr:hypothetical protein [Weeksellaceae bacterium]
LAASVLLNDTADIDSVTNKKRETNFKGEQHTDHIANGQGVSRHKLPTLLCFIFFPTHKIF